jgi:hypothetical protein
MEDMLQSGFFSGREIYDISRKGLTAHMVTALYKMSQYLNWGNFWEIVLCARSLLREPAFQASMDYYSARENRNFFVIPFFIRKKMPIAVLLTFKVQSIIYEVRAMIRDMKPKLLEGVCGKTRKLALTLIQWSIRKLEALSVTVEGSGKT